MDSSGWLDFFFEGQLADVFAEPIADAANLIVPTIVMHEVVKVLQRKGREDVAFKSVAFMRRGSVVPLDEEIALTAAMLGLEHRPPMADSIILATAIRHRAAIWTTDVHFRNLAGVRYFPKK